MFRKLADHATYANVVATLALFIALGGTATAARTLLTGADIKNGSLTGADVKDKSIGARDLTPQVAAALRPSGSSVTAQSGPAGAQGERGPAGDRGAEGVAGARGPAGPAGAAGKDGSDGAAGTPGAKGDLGERGPAGPTGPNVGPVVSSRPAVLTPTAVGHGDPAFSDPPAVTLTTVTSAKLDVSVIFSGVRGRCLFVGGPGADSRDCRQRLHVYVDGRQVENSARDVSVERGSDKTVPAAPVRLLVGGLAAGTHVVSFEPEPPPAVDDLNNKRFDLLALETAQGADPPQLIVSAIPDGPSAG